MPVPLLVGLLAATFSAAPEEAATPELLQRFRREFVEITPGEGAFPAVVTIGREDGPSERPARPVRFDRAFSIARYETPQNLWQALMGENPSRWQGARNAVEMVSRDDAVEFCRRATIALREAGLITEAQLLRLPSEAEWEYAARAGTTTLYSFGDDAAALDAHAWHTGNAAGNDPPVGAKRPNAWRLYDVHGYLWEWCADDWHDDYQGGPPDSAAWTEAEQGVPGEAKQGVLRGGSWKDTAERLTSSSRRAAPTSLRDDAVGFRCVLATGEEAR